METEHYVLTADNLQSARNVVSIFVSILTRKEIMKKCCNRLRKFTDSDSDSDSDQNYRLWATPTQTQTPTPQPWL